MKKEYQKPLVEVFEISMLGKILVGSGDEDFWNA